jgi:hypothetical protein
MFTYKIQMLKSSVCMHFIAYIKHLYLFRVSCEAIPEEISGMGTTPPSTENAGDHPTGLLSQRSYPGTSQVTQTITTTSNTVPPSPTTSQVDFNYDFLSS